MLTILYNKNVQQINPEKKSKLIVIPAPHLNESSTTRWVDRPVGSRRQVRSTTHRVDRLVEGKLQQESDCNLSFVPLLQKNHAFGIGEALRIDAVNIYPAGEICPAEGETVSACHFIFIYSC